MTQGCCSSSGSPWEKGFETSYKLACEKLAEINVEEQCRNSGAHYAGGKEVTIRYLGQLYRIMLGDGRVLLGDGTTQAPLRDQILILHYFTGAKGTPSTGKLIAYKQLPGGAAYLPTFSQRAITPLVRAMGNNPALLVSSATILGGRRVGYGDASVTIDAFDRVPITFVLWKGDEEVSPNGNILFDANISDYLCTEDITVLTETIVWKLVRSIRPN